MTISILKAALVIAILAMMIVVLLSMNHFLTGDFDSRQSDLDDLRDDVEKSDKVITDNSSFKELVKIRHRAR